MIGGLSKGQALALGAALVAGWALWRLYGSVRTVTGQAQADTIANAYNDPSRDRDLLPQVPTPFDPSRDWTG
jgi:hypothetical protein